MGKRFSPTLVGAFVLGAIGLGVITLVVLGSGRFFTGKSSYVLYFDRDVNGLRVGAPVKFRGVDIGTVDAIQLSLSGIDQQSKSASPNVKIPVVIDIDSKKIESRGAQDDLSDPAVMRHAIALGLRAELHMQSFVTGVLYAQGVNNFVNSTDLKNSVDQLGLAAKNLSEAALSIHMLANKVGNRSEAHTSELQS